MERMNYENTLIANNSAMRRRAAEDVFHNANLDQIPKSQNLYFVS